MKLSTASGRVLQLTNSIREKKGVYSAKVLSKTIAFSFFLLICMAFAPGAGNPGNTPHNYFASTTITSVSPGGALRLGIPFTITGTVNFVVPPDSVQISLNDGYGFRPVTMTGPNNWTYTHTPTHPGLMIIKTRAMEGGVWESTSAPSGPNVTSVNVLPNPDANSGPGGPILVVYNGSDPFGRYTNEILRNEGFNAFATAELGSVSAGFLGNYDVVILGATAISSGQASAFTQFVNEGGTLIAYRPDAQLDGLMGIGSRSGQRSNQYLLVNTADGSPGKGIVAETMQFHGVADNFVTAGATAVATFYSDATTPTSNAAVTVNTVGTNGGRAVAFAYDLNRSIVYTRQGNPAWINQQRTGPVDDDELAQPIRANDLFYGNSLANPYGNSPINPNDPQPDWVNLEKIHIPQADEQQRLLANLILISNYHRKPIPKFWYFPRRVKSVAVMTGDDHAYQCPACPGPVPQLSTTYFDIFKNMSGIYNTPEGIADWRAVRGTSYVYEYTPLRDKEAIPYQEDGFEWSTHFGTSRQMIPTNMLQFYMRDQFSYLNERIRGINPLSTERTHAILWWDWTFFPNIENDYGIRMDANYYHYPSHWVDRGLTGDKNGMMTGSAMPMRFADLDGTLVNTYQLATQLNDEAAQNYPAAPNEVFGRAISQGFYGAYCINWHTDNATTQGAIDVVQAAQSRGIPVITARQLLNWVDAKATTNMENMAWNGNTLTFNLTGGVRNLNVMFPAELEDGHRLQHVRRNGGELGITYETIKGIEYGFVDSSPGTYGAVGAYEAVYDVPVCDPITATLQTSATNICVGDEAQLTFTTTGTDGPFDIVVNGQTYENVTPNAPFATVTNSGMNQSLFNTPIVTPPASVHDAFPVKLGVRFRTASDGFIQAIRFYKPGGATATTHTVQLWNAAGGPAISTTISGAETESGWQLVTLPAPVAVTAGTDYIASYTASDGWYSYEYNRFDEFPITSGDLTAPASTGAAPNGVYRDGGGDLVFPGDVYLNSNYFVDVVYQYTSDMPVVNYELTSITDNSGCASVIDPPSVVSITRNTTCIPTPVDFVDFTGQAVNGNVNLNWSTAIELNNDHFEIERSTDSNSWIQVGLVKGVGNSSDLQQYHFVDPGPKPGIYYYRLKQVDFDGRYKYSKTIQVRLASGDAFELFQNIPNPVSGTAVINYYVPRAANLRISLFDNTGRMIRNLAQGQHNRGSYRVLVDKGRLPAGVYYYRLDSENSQLIKKMVVQ